MEAPSWTQPGEQYPVWSPVTGQGFDEFMVWLWVSRHPLWTTFQDSGAKPLARLWLAESRTKLAPDALAGVAGPSHLL